MMSLRQDAGMSPATIPTTLPAGYDQSDAKPTTEHVREPVQRPARNAGTMPSEVIDRLVVHIAGQEVPLGGDIVLSVDGIGVDVPLAQRLAVVAHGRILTQRTAPA